MTNVVPFPIEGEVILIARAATNLARRNGEAAARWWNTECHRLYGRYIAFGLSADDSHAMVNRFARAVQEELNRRAYPQHGGGAA